MDKADIVRGGYVKYNNRHVPLRVESDIHEFDGQTIIVGRLMYSQKSMRSQGMFAVSSLTKWTGKDQERYSKRRRKDD
jgi:hypothetical protein